LPGVLHPSSLECAGIETVYTAHANYFPARDAYSLAKELAALPVYWFQVR